ncbi:hypothetical protein [Paenibacillus solani]|uniref:Uncharacterized protein n=1 Tax=Paenibacillus solani TaxID=1705565 RepID=A0A0M1P458_9BACL|nr:hypothetical protein [Paenibacillus solani]KOR89080.1 hypothetical protein AM231_07815 [Paenibacillus solani]
MNDYKKRMSLIVRNVAEQAWNKPLRSSGLWFHSDVRDNFYYASYLFAASLECEDDSQFNRQEGKQLAEEVLGRVLRLQNREPKSPMYGHWPLNLEPDPEAASPHVLPVELMGSLMVFFHHKFESDMSEGLAREFETALEHIYQGGFFRKPLTVCNHHEAKYTAAKLIFGQRFGDKELLEDGKQSLRDTLTVLRREGMAEYGCLPWFWHWTQAFTCALELAEEPELKQELHALLDELWSLRTDYYLKGAWVGAHSRGWPHDAPRDGNVLHDYVQFGDFNLSEEMPRTEFAGFLFYEAPEAKRQLALNRSEPTEVRKVVMKSVDDQMRQLHSYAYVTECFAAGGLWERVLEFDNEQLRWMFSLPVRSEGKANQLYFFHPGEGYNPSGSDPRHQSEWMEVLYHKNVVLALYPLPESADAGGREVVGVLPEGEWLYESEALYGKVDEVYFAIHLSPGTAYDIREQSGYHLAVCRGDGIALTVEAVSVRDAEHRGIEQLKAFSQRMSKQKPDFKTDGGLEVVYTGWTTEDQLCLKHTASGSSARMINGAECTFELYSV